MASTSPLVQYFNNLICHLELFHSSVNDKDYFDTSNKGYGIKLTHFKGLVPF